MNLSTIPSDYQEIVAFRFVQKTIHSEADLDIIDRMINQVYNNKNTNVITSLSRIENDGLLSYLFHFIIHPKNTLYTQNIMYLLKYLNYNISFRLLVWYTFIKPICW